MTKYKITFYFFKINKNVVTLNTKLMVNCVDVGRERGVKEKEREKKRRREERVEVKKRDWWERAQFLLRPIHVNNAKRSLWLKRGGFKVKKLWRVSEICDPWNNVNMMLVLLIIPLDTKSFRFSTTAWSLTTCFVVTAIDLINNLLQVKMRKRYSVDKSLSHPWLQVRR